MTKNNLKLLEKLLNEFLDEEAKNQGIDFGKENIEEWLEGYNLRELVAVVKEMASQK